MVWMETGSSVWPVFSIVGGVYHGCLSETLALVVLVPVTLSVFKNRKKKKDKMTCVVQMSAGSVGLRASVRGGCIRRAGMWVRAWSTSQDSFLKHV